MEEIDLNMIFFYDFLNIPSYVWLFFKNLFDNTLYAYENFRENTE